VLRLSGRFGALEEVVDPGRGPDYDPAAAVDLVDLTVAYQP
jgi:hypothetical protein